MTTSMQRVQTAMAHEEPDRVPLFLLPTMHGAKELGLTIREYFSRPEHVVEGQIRMLRKYGGDCVNAVTFASLELEAFGGETVFRDDGPPNAAAPVLRRPEDIDGLEAPSVAASPALQRGLAIIRGLKEQVGDAVPIVGAVTAPFSLPILQMGFAAYIELLYGQPARFARLMAVNQAFCVEWAHAQVAAGATAVGYGDPMASPANVPRELYLRTGHPVAVETIRRIGGSMAMSLASAPGLSIVEDIVSTGAVGVAVSALEDLADWKAAARGRLTLIGNLNGIEMRRWTAADAEREVKRAIAKAGAGGGFILADNHGEIPWQVPDHVLLAIRDAVDRWGRYPLRVAE
jgi:uroporphyrinogen decarboxylase